MRNWGCLEPQAPHLFGIYRVKISKFCKISFFLFHPAPHKKFASAHPVFRYYLLVQKEIETLIKTSATFGIFKIYSLLHSLSYTHHHTVPTNTFKVESKKCRTLKCALTSSPLTSVNLASKVFFEIKGQRECQSAVSH